MWKQKKYTVSSKTSPGVPGLNGGDKMQKTDTLVVVTCIVVLLVLLFFGVGLLLTREIAINRTIREVGQLLKITQNLNGRLMQLEKPEAPVVDKKKK